MGRTHGAVDDWQAARASDGRIAADMITLTIENFMVKAFFW